MKSFENFIIHFILYEAELRLGFSSKVMNIRNGMDFRM